MQSEVVSVIIIMPLDKSEPVESGFNVNKVGRNVIVQYTYWIFKNWSNKTKKFLSLSKLSNSSLENNGSIQTIDSYLYFK